jgi:hypothetical protein
MEVAPGAIRDASSSASTRAIPALTTTPTRGRARTDASGHARVDESDPPELCTVDRLRITAPTRARQPARGECAAVGVAAAAIGATAAIPIDPIKGEVRDPKPAFLARAVSSALDV